MAHQAYFASETAACDSPGRVSVETLHRIRNELHAIHLGVVLYRQEMQDGCLEEAETTYLRIVGSIERLARDRLWVEECV